MQAEYAYGTMPSYNENVAPECIDAPRKADAKKQNRTELNAEELIVILAHMLAARGIRSHSIGSMVRGVYGRVQCATEKTRILHECDPVCAVTRV